MQAEYPTKGGYEVPLCGIMQDLMYFSKEKSEREKRLKHQTRNALRLFAPMPLRLCALSPFTDINFYCYFINNGGG
jgi:hypothetical protein